MADELIEPDFDETKEYELTLAINLLEEWQMDICSGDAVEDFTQVPLMGFIVGMLGNQIPRWLDSLRYQLLVEQVGPEKAFQQSMNKMFGVKTEENEGDRK